METRLSVRIVGPGVRPGKIALRDLQRIVHPLEQAIQALLPAPSAGTGRLLLSGLGKGSAVAELELDIELQPRLPTLESDPIRQLIAGIEDPEQPLPPEADHHIARMASHLPAGVDRVELTLHGTEARAQIPRRDPAPAPSTTETRTISGRLISVNFGSRRAHLEVPSTNRRRKHRKLVQLRFADELATDMQQCARQLVTATGKATVSAGGVQSLEVEKIWVEYDDRRKLWPAKRFRWPSPDELLDNFDVQDFLENIHGVDEDDE